MASKIICRLPHFRSNISECAILRIIMTSVGVLLDDCWSFCIKIYEGPPGSWGSKMTLKLVKLSKKIKILTLEALKSNKLSELGIVNWIGIKLHSTYSHLQLLSSIYLEWNLKYGHFKWTPEGSFFELTSNYFCIFVPFRARMEPKWIVSRVAECLSFKMRYI